MAAFTAKDVQALREKTGVGMMDCKRRSSNPTAIWRRQLTFCVKKALRRLPKGRTHRGRGRCARI